MAMSPARARTVATILLVTLTAVWGSTFFLIRDLVQTVPPAERLGLERNGVSRPSVSPAPVSPAPVSPAPVSPAPAPVAPYRAVHRAEEQDDAEPVEVIAYSADDRSLIHPLS